MTRCQLLLSLLEDAGERGITTSEILEAGVGSRYGARLMELRKQGHRITSERVREGSWRYVLDVETSEVGKGTERDPGTGAPSTGSEGFESPASVEAPALKLFESAA